jgi:general secretion pathway protein C
LAPSQRQDRVITSAAALARSSLSPSVPFTQRLRKNFTATLVGPVGVIVFLTIQGVAQIAEAGLGIEEKRLALDAAMRPRTPRAPAPPFHATSAAAILARNPFDSQVLAPPASDPELTPDDDSAPSRAPECDGVKVLAIIASEDPDFSYAALEDGKVPRKLLRRRGGDVGDRTVAFIGWDRVWLGNNGHLCQAAIFVPVPPDASRPLVSARPVIGDAGAPLDPTIAKGIERVSSTEFRIDRAIVPRILEHQAELARPRIALEQSGGKVSGVRLSGVGPQSLLGELGIENGDLLETVNGIDVSNTPSLVEMYSHLSQLDHLTAQVTRGGKPVRLDYDIR